MLQYSPQIGAEAVDSVEHPRLCFGLFTDSATIFAWPAPAAVSDFPEEASAAEASPLSVLELLYPPKLALGANDAGAARSSSTSVYLQSCYQLGEGAWSTVYRVDAHRLVESVKPGNQAGSQVALKFIWRRSTDSSWASQARKKTMLRELAVHQWLSRSLPDVVARLYHAESVLWTEIANTAQGLSRKNAVAGDGLMLLLELGQEISPSDLPSLSYVYQVLRLITRLHKTGICHGDLKMDNLLLFDTENGPQLRLIDFGLSGFLRKPKDRRPSSCFQLPQNRWQQYHPPELADGPVPRHAPDEDCAHGATPCDQLWHYEHCKQCHLEGKAFDLWSLGCVVLELLGVRFNWQKEKRLQTASGAAHLAEELVEHLEISCDSKARLSELLATLFTSDPATRCKEGEQKIEDMLEALEDWTVI